MFVLSIPWYLVHDIGKHDIDMVIAFLPLVCWVQGMAFKYFPEIMIHVKKTIMSMIYFCMLNTKKKSVISRRLWCSPENNNSQDICKISNITWKLLHQLSLQNLKLWEKDSINWSQQTAWFAASLDDSISLPPYWYREINRETAHMFACNNYTLLFNVWHYIYTVFYTNCFRPVSYSSTCI